MPINSDFLRDIFGDVIVSRKTDLVVSPVVEVVVVGEWVQKMKSGLAGSKDSSEHVNGRSGRDMSSM